MLQVDPKDITLKRRGKQVDDVIEVVNEWKWDKRTLKSFNSKIRVQENYNWIRFRWRINYRKMIDLY